MKFSNSCLPCQVQRSDSYPSQKVRRLEEQPMTYW